MTKGGSFSPPQWYSHHAPTINLSMLHVNWLRHTDHWVCTMRHAIYWGKTTILPELRYYNFVWLKKNCLVYNMLCHITHAWKKCLVQQGNCIFFHLTSNSNQFWKTKYFDCVVQMTILYSIVMLAQYYCSTKDVGLTDFSSKIFTKVDERHE